LQANIITYSAVISCCPWHWALQLLMELEEGHLRSDVVWLGESVENDKSISLGGICACVFKGSLTILLYHTLKDSFQSVVFKIDELYLL
jgi:uncharacterized membrane protein YkvI